MFFPMSRKGEYHKLSRVLQSNSGMRCEAVLLCAPISIGRWGKPVLLRAWISIASYLSLRRKGGWRVGEDSAFIPLIFPVQDYQIVSNVEKKSKSLINALVL